MNGYVDSAETLQLLSRMGDGDVAARDELLSRHATALRRCVGHRFDANIQSRIDASDVIQETQIDVIRRLDEFLQTRPMPFRLWLIKLAHQRLTKLERRHLAAAKRSVHREIPLPDRSSMHLARHLISREPSPIQRMSQNDVAQRVRRTLAILPEADREILMLRNFEQLSNSEAAQLLELNPDTTKRRYTRALVRLHTALTTEEYDEDGSAS